MFGLPRGSELVIILVVVLLLFGARKLPGLARSLGASAREFRRGAKEGSSEEEETDDPSDEADKEPAPPPTSDLPPDTR